MNGPEENPARRKNLRREYIARINRVIDHIESHLDEELTLENLARIANFSPYHFHRIFGALMGETLGQYIGRIRIEKAAWMLSTHPDRPITEIALDCGFSGSAPFARSFRSAFGMSASEWRAGGWRNARKNGQTNGNDDHFDSKGWKEFSIEKEYLGGSSGHQKWRITMKEPGTLKADVEVKEWPETHLAYIRHIGPYAGDAELFQRLFERLMTWAGPRGLLQFPETKVISMYHDDPELTDPDKLRVDACITVQAGTEVDGEVGKASIPAGQYAVAHFTLATDEYPQAWAAVFGGWLPESGYQPGDGPCFEVYHEDAKDRSDGKCVVDICIPVKPL